MKRQLQKACIMLLASFAGIQHLTAQQATVVDSTSSRSSVIVIAGKEYDRGPLHRLLWGRQWRNAWATPVRVPILRLDTAYGGLKPTKKGGGKQTKNLRLETASGREFAIRSVNKDFGKSIPEEFQGTFLQDIVDDQMSSSHPYAGLIVKRLAAAAGIYSTMPSLYFVPDQPQLDTFRKDFKNDLYTLEDRPGNANAKNYGAEKVESSEELYEALQKDPYKKIDQVAFAKARLFDLLIGDWDRHFDQWEWAKKDGKGNILYYPMPKDRDQAMASYDGILLGSIIKSAQLDMLQKFRGDIKNVDAHTWVYRNFDSPLTNEVSLNTWLQQAQELQQQITDQVIEEAVKQLPPEVYPISAPELISTLKARRDHLPAFAQAFYEGLSKEVVVVGSGADDKIELTPSTDGLQLNMYVTGNSTPYFSRSFNSNETKEIRIYGMEGADQFTINGNRNDGIRVRMLGGPGKDNYDIPSSASSKIIVYDDKDNELSGSSAKLRVITDTMLYKPNDKMRLRDQTRILPKLGFSNEDGIYAGLGLRIIDRAFMEEPFVSRNELQARYSFTQKAFSYLYNGMFRNIIRNIDLGLNAEYDQVRDQSFLGVGNNAPKLSDDRQYYRYRNKEANLGIHLIGNISQHQTLTVSGLYQMVQLYNDPGKYISLNYLPANKQVLDQQHFIGGKIMYDLSNFSYGAAPKNGFRLNLAFDHMTNTDNKKIVNRISGLTGFIVPLGPFSLSSKLGAAKLWGEPEFYQLNELGSGTTLRGYLRHRLYGHTAVYNQNELMWTFNVKSYLFNGKAGILGLYDQGRVWVPGETSDKWYTAFGGGIMIAPFNKISVTVAYAVSDEDKRISLRIGHLLSR